MEKPTVFKQTKCAHKDLILFKRSSTAQIITLYSNIVPLQITLVIQMQLHCTDNHTIFKHYSTANYTCYSNINTLFKLTYIVQYIIRIIQTDSSHTPHKNDTNKLTCKNDHFYWSLTNIISWFGQLGKTKFSILDFSLLPYKIVWVPNIFSMSL